MLLIKYKLIIIYIITKLKSTTLLDINFLFPLLQTDLKIQVYKFLQHFKKATLLFLSIFKCIGINITSSPLSSLFFYILI